MAEHKKNESETAKSIKSATTWLNQTFESQTNEDQLFDGIKSLLEALSSQEASELCSVIEELCEKFTFPDLNDKVQDLIAEKLSLEQESSKAVVAQKLIVEEVSLEPVKLSSRAKETTREVSALSSSTSIITTSTKEIKTEIKASPTQSLTPSLVTKRGQICDGSVLEYWLGREILGNSNIAFEPRELFLIALLETLTVDSAMQVINGMSLQFFDINPRLVTLGSHYKRVLKDAESSNFENLLLTAVKGILENKILHRIPKATLIALLLKLQPPQLIVQVLRALYPDFKSNDQLAMHEELFKVLVPVIITLPATFPQITIPIPQITAPPVISKITTSSPTISKESKKIDLNKLEIRLQKIVEIFSNNQKQALDEVALFSAAERTAARSAKIFGMTIHELCVQNNITKLSDAIFQDVDSAQQQIVPVKNQSQKPAVISPAPVQTQTSLSSSVTTKDSKNIVITEEIKREITELLKAIELGDKGISKRICSSPYPTELLVGIIDKKKEHDTVLKLIFENIKSKVINNVGLEIFKQLDLAVARDALSTISNEYINTQAPTEKYMGIMFEYRTTLESLIKEREATDSETNATSTTTFSFAEGSSSTHFSKASPPAKEKNKDADSTLSSSFSS